MSRITRRAVKSWLWRLNIADCLAYPTGHVRRRSRESAIATNDRDRDGDRDCDCDCDCRLRHIECSLTFGIFASQAAPLAPSRGEEAKMPNVSLMRFQKLDCYIAAKELARLVHEAGIAHAVLRDQACRSSVSCFLQLAEGLPNEGEGMRRKYFTESNNSLHETVAAIDLAAVLGAVPAEAAVAIQELAFRLKKMLRGLLHRS